MDSQQASGTLAQGVVKAIITYIRDNQLKVGETILSEGDFAQRLGVSRTVVREAFKALAAMNIIEVSAGRRARVSAFDGSVMALTLGHGLRTEQVTVQQVWDVRRAIELRAVALACMHRTDKEADRIVALSRKMRETRKDIATMTEHDIDFHVAIANATRNPLFPVLISSLTTAMRETNPIVWRVRRSDEEQLEVVDWHETVAQAIKARDPEAAVKAMSRHFDEATLSLVNSGFN
ncbi:MAG: FadR/GntR family transcriptional regulator [Gammaproteobacteria bacterium]|jgi:DNA-binding FadR family transcriptional regulator